MEALVHRAVVAMRDRYDEPLSLDALAKVAMMSKFHFLRTFQNVTGVTPARFLSAVRINEAKRLLRTTSLNVLDVSIQVGYNSVGSFTRRFTESVTLSPTQYRRSFQGDTTARANPLGSSRVRPLTGSIVGVVKGLGDQPGPVYVAACRSRIPEGLPVACDMVNASGIFRLRAVPAGTWYLLVASAAPAGDQPRLQIASVGPVRVTPGMQVHLTATVHPLRWNDPPLLIALPGLDPLAPACGDLPILSQ
jgi:AraC family transcriptional regulator